MKLDGGAMFGHAPKDLWSRWIPADERNMIEIFSNCLLVQTPKNNILFETGPGAFLSPEMKIRFQVQEENHVLLESLAGLGLGHEDISHVILSHLHFDHAGGLLTAWDESRDTMELLFSNAKYITGQTHYERSVTPHSRDRASFIPGLPGLLKGSGRLDLKNDKDRLCLDGLEIQFMESHGHTPGMLVSWIHSENMGKKIDLVFTGDLIPGHAWVNLPITMGYDRFPEGLVDEKQILLDQVEKAGALLFYPHDPVYPVSGLAVQKNKMVPNGLMNYFKRTG